jgi:hypothetical protein
MMESVDTTKLKVTMMEISLENADSHMLFVYIYFSNHSNSQMTFLCYNFPLSLQPPQTNVSLCFYLQLPSLTQSFTPSQTNFILLLYSLNTMSGFSPLPTCSSAPLQHPPILLRTVSFIPRSPTIWKRRRNWYQPMLSNSFQHSKKGNFQ